MGLRFTTVVTSALIAFGCASAFPRPYAPDNLQAELRSYYELATAKVDSKGALIVEGGRALVIRRDGIVGFGSDESFFADLCPSEFVGGELRPPESAACTTLTPATKRTFRLLQRVCVTSIDVADSSDSVSLSIVGCDASNRVRFTDAYRARLIFLFPRGAIGKSSPSQIEGVIGQVLSQPDVSESAAASSSSGAKSGSTTSSTASGDSDPCSGGGSAANPGEAKSSKDSDRTPSDKTAGAGAEQGAKPASSDSSNSGIAARPCAANPSAPAPESMIGIGQTPDQVKAVLGSPKTTTTHGKKIIYRYPNLKVVFVSGTVAAIEKI
jgi:hypothetical protein